MKNNRTYILIIILYTTHGSFGSDIYASSGLPHKRVLFAADFPTFASTFTCHIFRHLFFQSAFYVLFIILVVFFIKIQFVRYTSKASKCAPWSIRQMFITLLAFQNRIRTVYRPEHIGYKLPIKAVKKE